MFRDQCAECSQERLTSQRYTASLNDNTRDGMNTTAGRTQDREKPTQVPGIQTFLRPGYPIFTGDCDSLLKVNKLQYITEYSHLTAVMNCLCRREIY